MPTTYTPTSSGSLVLAYQQVSDGDKRKAASINPGLSGMSDDIARLSVGARTNASFHRTYHHFEYFPRATDPVFWAKDVWQWIQIATDTGTSNARELEMVLDFPHAAELTAVEVFVIPVTHGSLPAAMPVVNLSRINVSTGTITAFATATDPSATVGAYNVAHPIPITGLTEIVDRATYAYRLTITGEGNTNSMVGMVVSGAAGFFVSNTADQGAG